MLTFYIDEAKNHLFRLVDLAAKGAAFVIAKNGKPLVKVIGLNTPEPSQIKRCGFLAGQIVIPDDLDRMGETEIERLFINGK